MSIIPLGGGAEDKTGMLGEQLGCQVKIERCVLSSGGRGMIVFLETIPVCAETVRAIYQAHSFTLLLQLCKIYPLF